MPGVLLGKIVPIGGTLISFFMYLAPSKAVMTARTRGALGVRVFLETGRARERLLLSICFFSLSRSLSSFSSPGFHHQISWLERGRCLAASGLNEES